MDILTPSVCYLAALRRTQPDLDEIKLQIDRIGSAGRDEVNERLDAIFKLYSALGNATQNQSLSNEYRQTIYAKLRIGRISGARSETDTQWQSHVDELRDLYLEIYRCIEIREASKAQSAGRDLLNSIRVRLSSVISSSVVSTEGLKLG
jgi:DNA-binding FadR family transcriptional regulator